MASKCSVTGCGSVSSEMVSFKFPLDSRPSSDSVVCSKHFPPSDVNSADGQLRAMAVPMLEITAPWQRPLDSDSEDDTVVDFDDFLRKADERVEHGQGWLVHRLEGAVHFDTVEVDALRSPIRVIKVCPRLSVRAFRRDVEEPSEKLHRFLGKQNKIVRWSQFVRMLEEYGEGCGRSPLVNREEEIVDFSEISHSPRDTADYEDYEELQDDGVEDIDCLDEYVDLLQNGNRNEKVANSVVSAKKKNHCYICDLSYENEREFDLHLKVHVTMLPYRCVRCTTNEVVLKSLLRVNQHFQMHLKPLKCKFCDKRFDGTVCLEEHERCEHTNANDRFVCEICGKLYKSESKLRAHMQYHNSPCKVTCDICKTSLSTAKELKIHLTAHTGERSFKCAICDKKFSRRSNLMTHKRLHTQERPFECDQCDMRFRTNGLLKYHTSSKHVNLPIEILTCKVCKMVCTSLARLDRHMLNHEKKYQCEFCDYKSKRRRDVRDHQNLHTGDKPYKCEECPEVFATYESFQRHRQRHRRVTIAEVITFEGSSETMAENGKKLITDDLILEKGKSFPMPTVERFTVPS